MRCPHCHTEFDTSYEDRRLREKYRQAQQLVRAKHDSRKLQAFVNSIHSPAPSRL